ncbi:MAG: DMT family transporter [Myxococcota bacterium]|nr:DMT family transporter [Myxococcota bacterium]
MLHPGWVFSVGVVGIACAGLFLRLAQPAPPVVVGFYRMAIASVVLIAALGIRRLRARAGGQLAELAVSRRDVVLALLAGALFGTDIALWHHALVRTSIANATLLVNTTPIHVGLFTTLVLRQPLGGGFALGAGLALAGAAVLLGVELGDPRAVQGDALALAAALFYTGYILVMTRARATLDALTAITCMSLAAASVLGFYGLVLGDAFRGFPLQSWLAIGAAAVISQLIGAFAIVWAVRFMPPPFTAVALVAQPVVATALAWWWLGESVSASQAAGALSVLAGIAIVSRDERTRAG